MSAPEAIATAPASRPADEASAAAARRLFLACAWCEAPPAVQTMIAARGAAPGAWERAAAIARRVGQEPLFLAFLGRHGGLDALGKSAVEDLTMQSRYHAFRWAGIRDAVAGLLDGLRARGIRPLLLKGIAVAGELYEEPQLRPMRDVDVLVRPGELEMARRAALESGFRADPTAPGPADPVGHHHLPPLFHIETGTCLEIHHQLLHPRHAQAGFPDVDALWNETRPSRLFPESASLLEPGLALLALCAHVTHGDTIGRRAQNLIDVARFIERQGSALDWARVEAHAATPAVARALAVPLTYLAREGLATAPQPCVEMLLRRAQLRGWELRLLWALTDRYRIGLPGAWPFVSGRRANILWRQAIRGGGLLRRLAAALAELIAGRRTA